MVDMEVEMATTVDLVMVCDHVYINVLCLFIDYK